MSWNVKEIQQSFEEMIPFIKRNGFQLLELKRGYVKMTAPIEGNRNHFGVMYAGALFTLGELPGGAIYLTTFDTSRFFPLVKDVRIKFKAPTQTDAFIEVSLSEDEAIRISREAEEKRQGGFQSGIGNQGRRRPR